MIKMLKKLLEKKQKEWRDRKIEEALNRPIKDIQLGNFLGENIELYSAKHGIW